MTADPMQRARWHMAAAKIERDVRLSDLTDAEIDMLAQAIIGSTDEHDLPATTAAAEQPIQRGVREASGGGIHVGASRHPRPDDRDGAGHDGIGTDHGAGDRSGKTGLALLTREEGIRGEGWQSIETAPRDGTWVLCWGPDSLHGIARFGPNPIWSEYPDYTHWRPLPAPPAPPKDET